MVDHAIDVEPPAGRWSSRSVRIVRYGAILWLSSCTAIAAAGFRAIYEDTSIVRIEEFSRLYGRFGLGDEAMITALLALPLGFALVAAGVILARKSTDPAAILMAVGLVAVYFFTSGVAHGVGHPLLRHGMASTAMVLIVVFLTVFPTGRYEPRWSMTAPILAAAVMAADPTLAIATRRMMSDSNSVSASARLTALVAWGLLLAMAAAAQIQRYRTSSTNRQRLQSRWVLVGAFGFLLPPVAVLFLNASGRANDEVTAGLVLASALGSLVLPSFVLIAVFRHHLYDIDRIISRTVTYSLVAMVVALSYVVSVLLIPRIVSGSNDLVIAVSTLFAAAVFNPARRRIQRNVDRRFDRARYDAAREVSEMTERLASETELETVSEEVIDVIGRTLAPATASLWVRERR